jgi:hypothetical protein
MQETESTGAGESFCSGSVGVEYYRQSIFTYGTYTSCISTALWYTQKSKSNLISFSIDWLPRKISIFNQQYSSLSTVGPEFGTLNKSYPVSTALNEMRVCMYVCMYI